MPEVVAHANRITREDAGDRPAVDVRVVLFTVADGMLQVAAHDADGRRSIPREVPGRGESLDNAARRLVRSATGVHEQYLEQLYTLSVAGDETGWTVVVGYIALLCSEGSPVEPGATRWRPATELGGFSAPDRMVVEYALVRLRAKLGYTNIAFHLLPPTFTLTELQHAYEVILDRRLDKRNFRRRMIAGDILLETAEKRREGSHRPAALYRFRAEQEPGSYLTPAWATPAIPDTDNTSSRGRET